MVPPALLVRIAWCSILAIFLDGQTTLVILRHRAALIVAFRKRCSMFMSVGESFSTVIAYWKLRHFSFPL
jgi:hypothetical protein